MGSLVSRVKVACQILAGTRSFALERIDLKLRRFCEHRGGFFVEAGANDGVMQSNTLYFERYRGWTGLLVEPVPGLAERCKVNRPRSMVECCALVSFEYQEPIVEMTYCDLMSVVKGAMKSDEEEEEHIKKGAQVQRIRPYSLWVPARTLTSLLDRHGVRRIDLLSLDVEGYELNALKGLDFEKYEPTWILVEARYRDEVEALLRPLYEPAAELTERDILYRCSRH